MSGGEETMARISPIKGRESRGIRERGCNKKIEENKGGGVGRAWM